MNYVIYYATPNRQDFEVMMSPADEKAATENGATKREKILGLIEANRDGDMATVKKFLEEYHLTSQPDWSERGKSLIAHGIM